MLHRAHRPVLSRNVKRVCRAAAVLALLPLLVACSAKEGKRMKELAGTYVRTYAEGVTPELGVDNKPERHALTLRADGRWTAEHPALSLQQFDIPYDSGMYRVEGVTVMLDRGEMGRASYTIAGDTLYPVTPGRGRLGELATGMSMKIGENTFLLRER